MNPKKLALIPILALIGTGILPAQTEEELFSQAELDQMLAPIALYPDVLLSQVLMAATYPLEVVEASRWSRANPELEGEAAVKAVSGEDWDDSIKSLVGFPDLIRTMDENLAWTRRIGDAFLLQQEEVFATTQKLRKISLDKGVLDTLEHVTVEQQEEVIIIEPARVEVVYVPYYSPYYAYGNWWWYDYPPFYLGPPPVYYSSIGYHWGRGIGVSMGFYYSSCDWYRHNVVIVRRGHPHKSYHKAPVWKHNPHHRRGVHYGNDKLNKSYHRGRVSGVARSPRGSHENGQRPNGVTGNSNKRQRPDHVARSERGGQSPRATNGGNQQGRKPNVARSSSNERRKPNVARSSSNERRQSAKPSRPESNSNRQERSRTPDRSTSSRTSREPNSVASSNSRWASNSRSSSHNRTSMPSSSRPQRKPRAP